MRKETPELGKKALRQGASITAVLIAFMIFAAPAAHAQTTIGGHVGFVVPWITRSGGQNTTQFDQYNIGFPFGFNFKGQGPFSLDFEMIPFIAQQPPLILPGLAPIPRSHNLTLVVDPGVLYSLNHGITLGLRAAFSINSAQVGFIPLVNKSWKFKDAKGPLKAYFVEFDFPVQFNRPAGGPATNSFTFATHFGLGF